ncbi:MAG: SCO family protein [Planctomycetes bacterium]|nr:SCO family protein [Planctomycetota bacterium]
MSVSVPSWQCVFATLMSGAFAMPVVAGPTFADEKVPELEGVGITEHLDETIPLDLSFVDSNGADVLLRDYFDGEKPIIVTLNYYKCPMLCSLTLNGLTAGLEEMDWSLGNEFEVVTVSINPDEKAPLALKNKNGYLEHYDREGSEKGWHFLTGEQENITKLADALGFGYVFDKKTGEFHHTASIMFITPDGRISKYMNDVQFAGQDLKFALIEASEGKIGSTLEKLLLFNCFQYDPERNSYTPSAWKLMRTAAVLMLLVLAGGLAVLGWAGPKRSSSENKNPQDMDGQTP